jgi:pyruvate,orthophosphate dikinase
MTRYVYRFGAEEAEGRGDQVELLGAKGAGLAEMTSLGVPVPPGFTLTTEVCNHFFAHEHTYPSELPDQVDAALDRLGALTDTAFGDPDRPLLLAVRAGPPVTMAGVMESVLNLGRCALCPRLLSPLRRHVRRAGDGRVPVLAAGAERLCPAARRQAARARC